ncbi:hypothetical protein JCM11491_003622 [Sporobolomyces phaffii]
MRDFLTKVFPSVTKLALLGRSWRDLDVSDLQLLPNLTDLSLVAFHGKIKNVQALPKLRSLSLSHVSQEVSDALLAPAVLPNVRALSVREFGSGGTIISAEFKDFLPQLEAFFFEGHTVRYLPPWAQTAIERTLCDTFFGALIAGETGDYATRKVRVEDSFWDGSDSAARWVRERLEEYVRRLESDPECAPRSLYLDSTIEPTTVSDPDLRRAVEALADLCAARELELVFERIPRDFMVDPFVSPEFWRRCRASNARKREGQ